MRVAAVWFPDWPIQAAGGQGPMVIARNHAVAVCDRRARRAGVRRGMRLRQAQALCPEAVVVEANPDRDGAAFAEVAAGLDAVASSVEGLRPHPQSPGPGAAPPPRTPPHLSRLRPPQTPRHPGLDWPPPLRPRGTTLGPGAGASPAARPPGAPPYRTPPPRDCAQ